MPCQFDTLHHNYHRRHRRRTIYRRFSSRLMFTSHASLSSNKQSSYTPTKWYVAMNWEQTKEANQLTGMHAQLKRHTFVLVCTLPCRGIWACTFQAQSRRMCALYIGQPSLVQPLHYFHVLHYIYLFKICWLMHISPHNTSSCPDSFLQLIC